MPLPSLKTIVLIKKARPKKVTLKNGRCEMFMARCEKAKRADLPANEHLKSYPLRAAPNGSHYCRRVNQQCGQDLGSLLRLAKKVVRNPIEKKSAGKWC